MAGPTENFSREALAPVPPILHIYVAPPLAADAAPARRGNDTIYV